jgi:poly(3-hydroxybutyrate) depolymerase
MMKDSRALARGQKAPVLVALPLSFALLAAACGTGSNGSGTGGSSGASSAPSSSGGASSVGTSSGGASIASSAKGGGASSAASSDRGGASSTGGTSARGTSSGGTSDAGGISDTGGNQGGRASSTGGAGTSGTGGAGTSGTSSAGGSATGGSGTKSVPTGGTSVGTTGSSVGGTGGASSGGGSTASGTAVPSPGCGKTSTVKFSTVPGESGSNVGTGEGGYVTVNGRGFAMRLPDKYDNSKPYWLFFGFHWNGGNSKEVDTGGSNGYISAHFGLQKLSNNGAFFVAPDGLNAGWGGDNLPFVDDMVKLITENYCIDMSRLYANGFSYGGGMSYAIACARAKTFRAVAIYEGAQLSGCEGGNDPIAYWQMAGTTDNTCNIDMGKGLRDKFVKNNGCTGPTTEPPRPKSISEAHICTDYTGCSSGHPLRWCVHPAGHGNAIVDGTSDLYNSCATPPKTCSDTCKCTWVPADVWKFFTSL